MQIVLQQCSNRGDRPALRTARVRMELVANGVQLFRCHCAHEGFAKPTCLRVPAEGTLWISHADAVVSTEWLQAVHATLVVTCCGTTSKTCRA